MDAMIQKEHFVVIDVRESARFKGEIEPIDLVAGHIPGATNIPFTANLDAEGFFLSPDELKTKYQKAFENIPFENRVVHCGSGVTACHTLLSLIYHYLNCMWVLGANGPETIERLVLRNKKEGV
jgi:thiosulfate/3-mercaptopyruvate sulfurtransferase